jgi:hypothetical protein
MKSHVFGFALLSATVIAAGAPAQAQNGSLTRSFVSSAGSDSNACTITAPCQSFAEAYTKIGANGIIAALDPGKYGPLIITGPVTVNGNGWAAITGAGLGGDGIIVIAGSSANVILIGLEIDGAGTGGNGIEFDSGGTLVVINCTIANFNNSDGVGNGILFQPTSGQSNVMIKDTTVLNSGNAGIYITPQGSAIINAVLNHDTADLNNYGIYFDMSQTSGGVLNAEVLDSHAGPNSTAGLSIITSTGMGAQVFASIKSSTFEFNHTDVDIEGTGARPTLSHDLIGSLGGLNITVYTDGTNDIHSTNSNLANIGTQ